MTKLKCAVAFLVISGTAFADEPWHLLIEPSFVHYPAEWPIEKAKSTVLVPARFVNGEVLPLQREEIVKYRVTRSKILDEAPACAVQVLATLKPDYVRDKNGVIQYAVLASESPLTASAVLAPGFARQFTDTLGTDILIAIPTRYRIYVFPRLSPAYKDATEMILLNYHSSPEPASRELFLLKDDKLVAVGTYE